MAKLHQGLYFVSRSQFLESEQGAIWAGLLRRPNASIDPNVQVLSPDALDFAIDEMPGSTFDPASNALESRHYDAEKPTDSSKGEMAQIKDPLKWFGVFVSPALRSSQDNFRTAVSGVIALTNIDEEEAE
ncbi:uncharacterized protein KY384_001116 [Bacidia gigantensis]|uniref:uncharacterized protein n=1 Tax=Bacidia gigantensis TaxID=2732470 RepID=UPI001D044876|nr:uncharacterized protein KY384_001116 [Bacidia gigantensis]KAG8534272.1 hypothetical protein KY384_001116 [Bacidia gigantensis]